MGNDHRDVWCCRDELIDECTCVRSAVGGIAPGPDVYEEDKAMPVGGREDLAHLRHMLAIQQIDGRGVEVQLQSCELAARGAAIELGERVVPERIEAAEEGLGGVRRAF